MNVEKKNYKEFFKKDRLEKIVYFSFLIFLSLLYLSNRNIAAKFYYITSSFVLIYIFFTYKNIIKLVKNRIGLSCISIISYSLISSFFINGIEYLYIKSSIRVFLFIAASILFFRNEKDINCALKIILVFTVLGSFPDLYDFFISGNYQNGTPLGQGSKYLWHIYAGGIYAISAMVSFYLFFTSKDNKIKLIYLIFFIYLSSLVYLSQSRAAILCYFLAIMLYLVLSRNINLKYVFITLATFSILGWVVNFWVFKFSTLLERKDAGRFAIWDKSLDIIMDKIIFGHGLGADFKFYHGKLIITEPHNLYLYALFTGGLICLVLLMLLYWMAIKAIYCNWNFETGPFLSSILLFIIIFNFFDSRKIVDDIGVGWPLFWVPVGIIAAYSSVCEVRKNIHTTVVDTTQPPV